VTVNDREVVFALSDPEKVVVVVAGGGLALAAAVTTAVGAELATPDPAAFMAVTLTAMVAPTSVLVSAYVWPVAPVTGLQAAPPESQRCH
jgi:hypothetical protein